MKRSTLPLFLALLSICYVVSNVQILKASRGDTNRAPISLGLPRLSERVVVIVLDGVPVRVAYDKRIMPFVVDLAAKGASGVSRAPEETTTPAGVRALATGQNPTTADMLDMFSGSEYRAWTVFDDVVARGEKVSLSGDKAWTSLLASRDPDGARVSDIDTRLYEDVHRVLGGALDRYESRDPPTLLVVHIGETDRLGHLYGTESQEYKTRMRAVDEELRAFAARVVTDNSTLVITADHGNDVFGSHGGEGDVYRNVPIIMTGRGIQKGAHLAMDARALPGVIAVLLGTRIPAEMQAVIPAGAFALTLQQRTALVLSNALELRRLAVTLGVPVPDSFEIGLRRFADGDAGSPSDSALSGQGEILSRLVKSVDAASPLSAARILWALILISALFVVAFEVLWPISQFSAVANTSISLVIGLLFLELMLPRFAVPLLSVILMVEVATLGRRMFYSSRRSSLIGMTAAVALTVLAAVRFAYMPQLKALLQATAGRLSLVALVAIAFALLALS
jgi:Type I phosphodiesterase / nucleotide pyrophosphatase